MGASHHQVESLWVQGIGAQPLGLWDGYGSQG